MLYGVSQIEQKSNYDVTCPQLKRINSRPIALIQKSNLTFKTIAMHLN